MYSFSIHHGNSCPRRGISDSTGSRFPTIDARRIAASSRSARLGSARCGSRVLSGSPAAAIGEIVKRPADGLVVSGISNWPVAISRRKPVRRPALDVCTRVSRLARVPSRPVFFPLARALSPSFLRVFLLRGVLHSLSSYPYNRTRGSTFRVPATSLGFTFTVIHATGL